MCQYTIKQDLQNAGRLKQQLEKLFEESFRTTIPDEPDVEPAIAPCQDPKFGDYQCNNSMGLWAKVKGKGTQFKCPYPIAEAIMKNLPSSEMIESCTVSRPGFINVILSKHWMARSIHKMLIYGIETWAPELPVKRAVVDFSSPNIAKEMHVGHLRSTIIGDTLARMLEYSKVEVLRRNHVGDWGTQVHTSLKLSMPMLLGLLGMKRGVNALRKMLTTPSNSIEEYNHFQINLLFFLLFILSNFILQPPDDIFRDLQFGMLIEYLFEKFPSGEVSDDQAIGDLEAFYKASKQRFDSDPVFKERAQKAVVSLQGGEEKYRKAWAQICEISRRGYERVYQRLGVHIEEKGESFYNSYIPGALELLNEKGLIEESEGARVIFIEGKNIPLIVVKRDGGYNYASTDLAALWYRLNEEKAEWIIYLTDVGQREHFEMVFTAAKRAGWLPAEDYKYPKSTHVGFGLVLGEDGKRFELAAAEEWTAEELDRTAEAVGYGAVNTVEKSLFLQRSEHTGHPNTCLSLVLLYADLKNNRTTNYTFSFDQMLNDKGNTAVYLLYAHARICSIIRRSGKDIEELKKTGTVELAHADERVLGLRLLQFPEIVEEACTNLLPNVLCEYLYSLSENSTRFYTSCQFLNAEKLINGSVKSRVCSKLLLEYLQVVGSAEETSRLLLCEATAVVMRQCFYLLGLTPVYKI
ncbi:hypothetical protein DH2020_006307 [Rehmannia glutinosa]|uniref:arginine--tRNA ligase n=1 Tax=Rehmannia glutinosa TaxID=99300 RepID=A0ABR0XIW3_REHGL